MGKPVCALGVRVGVYGMGVPGVLGDDISV